MNEQRLLAVNVILLLLYTICDMATSWHSSVHGPSFPGFLTVLISIAHSGVLAVTFLILTLLKKEKAAQSILRQSKLIFILGVAAGILIVGIWILK